MTDPTTVKTRIEAGIPGATAHVYNEQGDGEHFDAHVVSATFDGLPLVRQHQAVYQALGDMMQSAIHALALQTYTPTQWAARNG
jgi:stress-induced morphogen